MSKIAVSLLLLTLSAGATRADHYVAHSNQTPVSPYTSWSTAASNIQDAVDAAIEGSNVYVAAGTYYPSAGIDVVNITTKSLELRGVGGRENVIIDGSNTHCGIYTYINSSVSTKRILVDGFTVTNCTGSNGGGIVLTHSSVSSGTNILQNCIVSGNHATGTYGGGIYVAGTVDSDVHSILSNCVVTGNASVNTGGGIAVGNASTEVKNCQIEDNFAERYAGGLYIRGNVKVLDSTIANNTATYYGGGLAMYDVHPMLVTRCRITGNLGTNVVGTSGLGSGGGVYLWACPSGVVSNCLIANNTVFTGTGASVSGGGGVLMSHGLLTHSTVVSNRVHGFGGQGGGGIFAGWVNSAGYLSTVRNCLIAYNTAEQGYGGGIVHRYRTTHVQNCTIVSNETALGGGGVNFMGYVDGGGVTQGVAIVDNSIIHGNTDGWGTLPNVRYNAYASFTRCCTDPLIPAGDGNIDDDPMFVDPADGNFRLQLPSPCRNVGVFQSWMTGAVDLDGSVRIDPSGLVDMGCYELYVPAATVVTIR